MVVWWSYYDCIRVRLLLVGVPNVVKLLEESVYSFKVIVQVLNGVGKIVLREEALVFRMLVVWIGHTVIVLEFVYALSAAMSL